MRQLLTCILLTLVTFTYAAKGPTDEQLKGLCREAGFALRSVNDQKQKCETFLKMASESQKKYDINKITTKQIDLLFTTGGIMLDDAMRQWLAPVLKTKAETEGTVFAYYRWKYYPRESEFSYTDSEVNVFADLIQRENIDKVIADYPEASYDLINSICRTKGENWQKHNILPSIKKILTYNLSEDAVNSCVNVFNTAMESDLSKEEIENIRQMVVKIYDDRLKNQQLSINKRRNITKTLEYLNGSFATNTLIGNKAPALHFKWVSENGTEKTLDDFKGKVVMLDFWATKCGPCLKLFPEIAKLQEHYKGSDVVILGVTSIMGYFIDKPNKRTVNTTGNPEKEMALMPDYQKGMGMTWRVAFTEEDVMNVNYGVLGIPHVTIIDKKGIVRYNDVTGDNDEKIELIDNLLKE